MNKNKNRIKLYWLFFFAGLFISYQPDYSGNKILLKAERLIYTSPDSAYLLLTNISHP